MKPKRRIYDYICVNGTKLLTLFDSGARNSYITRKAAKSIGIKPTIVPRPFKVGLGGKARTLKEDVRIAGELLGFPIIIYPFVVDGLGMDEKGNFIDVLFSITDMERWFVDLDFRRKKIDMSHYTKDFIEY